MVMAARRMARRPVLETQMRHRTAYFRGRLVKVIILFFTIILCVFSDVKLDLMLLIVLVHRPSMHIHTPRLQEARIPMKDRPISSQLLIHLRRTTCLEASKLQLRRTTLLEDGSASVQFVTLAQL